MYHKCVEKKREISFHAMSKCEKNLSKQSLNKDKGGMNFTGGGTFLDRYSKHCIFKWGLSWANCGKQS